MRKGLLVAGVILLLIGLVSVVYPMAVGTSSSIEALPNLSEPVPPILGSGTFTVHWSGATSSTHVVLFECVTSNCSEAGPILANVTGASGTFSVTLQAGKSYGLFEYGTPISVPATATLVGISLLVLIGIVLAVVGLAVVGLSFVSRRAPAPEEPPAMPPESPPAPYAVPPPVTPTPAPVYIPPPAAAAPPRSAVEEEEPAPTIAAAPTPPAGNRPPRKCAHCGTMNEPWITNCRKCKRPLASTGA